MVKSRAVLLRRALAVLFVVAVPLFLITNSVTWAVNDLRVYRYGFDQYDVSQVTGIDDEGLMSAARQIRGYFNSTTEPIHVRARVYGEERDLFNPREVVHMRDVRRLIWGVYGIGVLSGVYVVGVVFGGLLLFRRALAPALPRMLMGGAALTIGLVILVGLASVIGFEGVFRAFHEISFANDFWMLDPRRDYLVMMFPEGFWFDATMFVALVTVTQALVIGGLGLGLAVLRRRRESRLDPKAPAGSPSVAEL